MKNIWFIIFTLVSNFAYASTPTITLRYSFIFDQWCSEQTGIEITEIEKNRLNAKFKELQTEWDKTGPVLLQKMESMFNKKFIQNEMIATVFLCKKTPSISLPLLINGNWFVRETPYPSELVADIIFHELIHTFLVDHFDLVSSPVLKKFKNEGPGVLSHLHLMAIQKRVYLELGLKDRIERVIRFDSENYKGAYKRAWEIVNSESEDSFVAEIINSK